MVAVFTGLGAGFERSSAAQIGTAGLLGGGVQGRGGDVISVNAATGNLLINRQDDFLVGKGRDVGISRTYNSLGALDENGDHWRQSTDRRVRSHSGSINAAGSTINRISADGSEVTYTYKTISGVAAYWATDGAGAHDKITYASSKWTWTDGNSGAREVYFGTGTYIREAYDRDNNKVTFTYSGSKLSKVTTADGGYLKYTWSGNNITSIETYANGGSVKTHTRTRYAYDSSNRLIKVTTDLTPENSSVSDGKIYATNYSYHGSTKRIASVTQTDGSRVDFAYDSSGRITHITQKPGNGEPDRQTRLTYASNNAYTNIYDPSGTRAILYHDANEQLTRSRIYAPANGIDHSNYFTYDSSGNVTSVKDAQGKTTTYQYDARGNVTKVIDQAGRHTNNIYDANNNLTRVQSERSDATASNVWGYDRFVYDGEGHLRYSISAQGSVTEYRYDSAGNLTYEIQYPENGYSTSSAIPTLSQMDAWRNGRDRNESQLTRHLYDAKGNRTRTINYGDTNASGGATTAEGYADLRYTYDSGGRLLTSKSTRDIGSIYTYDGLGRMVTSRDVNGGTTSIVFNDAATKTIVTTAGGAVTTSTYNKAGNLISTTSSGSFDVTGTSTHKYDKDGRLRVSTDETGLKTYFIYDEAGNNTAIVDHAGFVQEFRYDKNGRQIAAARYTNYKATAARTAMLATLDNPNNTLQAKDVRRDINQATNHHSYDIWQWTAYDNKGQVTRTVMGDGSVTTYSYDHAGRLVQTKGYFNKLSAAQLTNLHSGTSASAYLPSANAKDAVDRTFYDRDGRVVGTLNGDGYLTRITYDKAGRKIQEDSYVNAVPTAYRTGTFNAAHGAISKSTATDLLTRYVYDGQGNLRFQINPLGRVTEYVYGSSSAAIGLVRQTINYAQGLSTQSNYKYTTVKAAVAALGSASSNRSGYAVYNTKNQMVYSIDSTGSVTRFNYDNRGNVTKTTQYANTRTTSSVPTEGQMNSWAAGNAANARISRNYYTAGNVLRFSVDAEGYVKRFDYDAAGRMTREIRWTGKVTPTDSWSTSTINSTNKGGWVDTKYSYDHQGRLSSVYDANGTRNYKGYYANGEVAWDIRAYGQGRDESRVLFVNDAAGRLKHKFEYNVGTSGSRNQTNYAYDGLGNLTQVVDTRNVHAYATANQTTNFTHDKRGNVLTQTNAEGGVSSFTYNGFGQVKTSTDPNGNTTTNSYNRAGELTRTTDALGYHTDFTYTAFGEQRTVKRNGATTTFAYDKLGQVTRVTDALGKYEAYSYTAFGQRASVRNKLGGYTHNTYDKRGQMTQSRVIANVYNSTGGLVASEIINKYEYDSRGNQTKAIEAFGRTEARTTTYVYDNADQLIQKKGDAVSIYTSGADSSASTVTPTEYFTYDRRGNLIESKDANGARTLYYYDSMDRVTHQISPEGTLVRNFYDANSNLMETRVYGTKVSLPTNALGTPPAGSGAYRRTTFVYDKLNRMTDSYVHDVQTAKFGTSLSITAATNDLRTQYQYDANGNVTKVIDPNGGQTVSTYDALGRKTRQVDAGGYVVDWTYNADGNVTRELKHDGTGGADNRITDFFYDLNGRRTGETRYHVKVFNGSTGETTVHSNISYTYNALGQVTRKTEATGEYIDYAYDNQGRMNYETRSAYDDYRDGTTLVSPKVQYLYNGLNDVSRVYKYGTTGTVASDSHYVYAKGGRLTSVTDGNGFVRTYRYDAKGQMVREEYARVTNGATQIEGIGYDFDKEGRVTAQGAVVKSGSTWSRGGAALDTVNTRYNAFGDVSERGINGKYAEKMAYDNAGRLWRTNSGDGAYKYFMYDNNGNQSLVMTSNGRNIDNKTIAQVLAVWGVSSNGANANRINTDYESDMAAVITKYDARNLAIEVREPEREHHNAAGTKLRADFVTKRGYNAFGEVISETDANNKTINYTYNTMGRRTKVQSPTVSITGENGVKSNVRPTEYYYYDISGRLVASKDANGNLTKQTLLAGTGYNGTQALITKTTAADGSTVTTGYDIQGNARKITDQLGRVTTNTFDKMGNLTQINHASGLIDYFSYDGLGQQYKQWNNVAVTNSYFDKITGTTIPGGPDFASTDYDAQGRIVVQRAIGGDITATSYSFSGTGVLAGNGGWLQTTTIANGKQSKVYKDVFNKAIQSHDLENRQVNYTYDKGGRLAQASGVGLDTQTYHYLNTSKLDKLVISGAVYSNYNVSRTTDYGYDKTGNLTSEKFTQTTTVQHSDDYYDDYYEAVDYDDYHGTYQQFLQENGLVPGTYTTTTHITLQNARATYDALGRIKSWSELGTAVQSGYTTKLPAASKVFEYDAQGNIRRTLSTHRTLDGQGVASTTTTTKDMWYKFDNMNRMTTADGALLGTSIVRGANGVDIAYDAAGQRAYTLKDTTTYTFPKGGTATTTTTTHRENYTYNTGGQVTQVRTTSSTTGTPGAGGTLRSSMSYDAMGRQTLQKDYEANGTTVAFQSTKIYNNKSQITNDTSITKRSDGTFKSVTTYDYGAGTSYALGAANTVTTANYKNNSHQNTSRTTNSYAYYNGAVQTRATFDGNISSSSDRINTTYYTNSKSGVLLSARVSDGRARTVTFTVDNQGQTIRRDERDYKAGGDPHEIWYRYGGTEMGYVGNNGTFNTSYSQSITDRTTTPTTGTNAGAFKHGRTTGANHADFESAYKAINSYSQGSTSGSYTVRSGDTLQSIAANIYGDSSLWYKIASANGMTGSAALIEGQSLNLPSGVVKSTHNASTFKPYAPGDVQGDLNPTTPQPQNAAKGKKCGVLGAILLVVVAVVVTLATAGAAAAIIGPAGAAAGTAGAAGSALAGAGAALTGGGLGLSGLTAVAVGAGAAAAGSIASQAVGVATGIQDKFSWKNVALAAIGGGISAGLGNIDALSTTAKGLTTADKIARGAASAAAGSAISQGIGVATGLQDKFSWASVAAAGVAGGVSAGISGAVGRFAHSIADGRTAGAIAGAIQGGAAAIASAATRSAINGTSFSDGIIAAIPDVVGQALSGYIDACFVADTLIHTPDGLKRIDEIKVGDWVYSRDEHFNNHDVHQKQVIELYRFENRTTLDVTIAFKDGAENVLRTTPEHPFAVIEGRVLQDAIEGHRQAINGETLSMVNTYDWRSAGDLSVGDRVIGINGQEGLVTALDEVDELSTVHNFAVEDHHTYYVGESGVWVHNRYKYDMPKDEYKALKETHGKEKADAMAKVYREDNILKKFGITDASRIAEIRKIRDETVANRNIDSNYRTPLIASNGKIDLSVGSKADLARALGFAGYDEGYDVVKKFYRKDQLFFEAILATDPALISAGQKLSSGTWSNDNRNFVMQDNLSIQEFNIIASVGLWKNFVGVDKFPSGDTKKGNWTGAEVQNIAGVKSASTDPVDAGLKVRQAVLSVAKSINYGSNSGTSGAERGVVFSTNAQMEIGISQIAIGSYTATAFIDFRKTNHVAFAHAHRDADQTVGPGDNLITRTIDKPNFMITRNSRKITEIGRQTYNSKANDYVIRELNSDGTARNWKNFDFTVEN
ncbi:polymorphic toxin-type HINT domain-containing protein [Fretibacter rubidus]|uniref:polymorphic toxin-type HINT domain-containing protein n=1 Tax=Fretibacter rubidus TaxID=570162 RepID=UPI00352A32B8